MEGQFQVKKGLKIWPMLVAVPLLVGVTLLERTGLLPAGGPLGGLLRDVARELAAVPQSW